MIHGRIIAVVITYNRRTLLPDCLDAILAQTRAPDEILVVDNACTDGTGAMIRERYPEVRVVTLPVNVGSTGGIYAGLEAALAADADWIWTLDDDAIARPNALELLLRAPDRNPELPFPSLLASRVEWIDGRAHPVNQPIARRRDVAAMVEAFEVGLIPLRANTFVGLLMARSALERHGLPIRQYFFQTEDIEHTARLLREGVGYVVPDSVVEHRTTVLQDPFVDVPPERFYYHLRNVLFMMRGHSWERHEKPAWGWIVVWTTARFLTEQHFSLRSLRTVSRALRDGFGPLDAPG